MSAFVEKFLKHLYSASDRRILKIHCTTEAAQTAEF